MSNPHDQKKRLKIQKNSRGTHEGAKRVFFRRGKREKLQREHLDVKEANGENIYEIEKEADGFLLMIVMYSCCL